MDKKVNVWIEVKAREEKEVVCPNCNEKIKYRLSNVIYKTINSKNIYKIKELIAYIPCYNCHKDIILKGDKNNE